MKRIVVAVILAVLAAPALTAAQARMGAASPAALSPSVAARYKPGARQRPMKRVTPVTATAAARAANPSRKALLSAAAAGKLNVALTRATYLETMRKAYGVLDKFQDFSLDWQPPNPVEPLGKVGSCVIVTYQFQPAKTEKDKANPGKFINTPASYTPVDWLSFPEVLAAVHLEGGQCLAIGVVDRQVCLVGNQTFEKEELLGPPPSSSSWAPPPSPFAGIPHAAYCFSHPDALGCKSEFEQACIGKGGHLITKSQYTGCEQWEQFGPDSREAFLKVAALNFDAEDWDHNGTISGAEGKYLCRP